MKDEETRHVGSRMNVNEGSMSVHDYSLKFIQLPMYIPSFVSNPRDKMSRFVTGVSNLVKEEYCFAMHHGDMNISRIMVHSQSMEECKLERMSKLVKRSRPDEEIQHMSKKRFYNQDALMEVVLILRGLGVKNEEATFLCQAGMNGWFGCGKIGLR